MIDIKVASLLAVAETRNFTKAAEKLSLTQPAISHHIHQLEEELGTKIFLRNKGNLRLTDPGEVVVAYAKRMNVLFDRLKTTLSDQERHLTRLRIGITHTAESNRVAEVLAEYSNQTDGTIITIITDSIKNLYTMLGNYELDLAIVEGKADLLSLNSLLLDTDYLVCVVSNDNPLSKQSMVTMQDLRRERMILRSPKSGTVNLFVANLASNNESIENMNVILEVDNIATIKDLVQKNFGISILPRSTCVDEILHKKLTVLPIENMSMVRETNIVYQKDFSHPEVLQEITRLYRHMVKNQKEFL